MIITPAGRSTNDNRAKGEFNNVQPSNLLFAGKDPMGSAIAAGCPSGGSLSRFRVQFSHDCLKIGTRPQWRKIRILLDAFGILETEADGAAQV